MTPLFHDQSAIVGTAAAVGGATGLTIQSLTDYSSLFLIGINVIVAGLGIWLVVLRIAKARRELRGTPKNDK